MLYILFFILLAPLDLLPQDASSAKKNDTMIISSTRLLPLVVYQPMSPLKMEFLKFQSPKDGGSVSPIVRFRNTTKKTIKAYKVVWLFPGGAGGALYTNSTKVLPGELLPDGEIPTIEEPSRAASKKHSTKEKPVNEALESIVLFAVVRVEFEDNSFFEDEEAIKALEAYLDKIKLMSR